MASELELKDIAQLAVSAVVPFIAVGGALLVAAAPHRERIACIVSWGWIYGGEGPDEAPFLIIHNRGTQSVAVSAVRYLAGFPAKIRGSGTALDYEDPTDVNFPYIVAPGEIKRLRLDEMMALRLIGELPRFQALAARLFRRPRIFVEATTTTGLRKKTEAESTLPWTSRASWMRR